MRLLLAPLLLCLLASCSAQSEPPGDRNRDPADRPPPAREKDGKKEAAPTGPDASSAERTLLWLVAVEKEALDFPEGNRMAQAAKRAAADREIQRLSGLAFAWQRPVQNVSVRGHIKVGDPVWPLDDAAYVYNAVSHEQPERKAFPAYALQFRHKLKPHADLMWAATLKRGDTVLCKGKLKVLKREVISAFSNVLVTIQVEAEDWSVEPAGKAAK